MEKTPSLDATGKQVKKGLLQDTPFVVFLFMPGVWKKEITTSQTICPQPLFKYLDGIMLNDTDIVDLFIMQLHQETTDPWPVHLNTQKIMLGPLPCHLCHGCAIAKTNLQKNRPVIAEGLAKVNGLLLEWDAKTRPELIKGPLLTLGPAPLAQHIAADRAMWPWWICLVLCHRGQLSR